MKAGSVPGRSAPRVTIRAANRDDRKLLWEWANDPEVRAVSFHSDPIPWEDHVRWFDRKLGEENCVLYIACNQSGSPIGQVRFDLDAAKATISISLGRHFRGRGLGVEVLRAACRQFFSLRRGSVVHAWVKQGNEASLRAFRKAGFLDQAPEMVNSKPAWHLVLEAKDPLP